MTNKEAFPDKKRASVSFDRITAHIEESHKLIYEADVGQEEATFLSNPDYPELPIFILHMTDTHYGSVGVDYQMLSEHLSIVEDTPNFYLIHTGDHVDNFSAVKHPEGMMGDAVTPQLQAQAWLGRMAELDRQNKILAMGHGNHDDWIGKAGYDFYQSFMADFAAPIFNQGGILNVMTSGGVRYRIAMNHQFWGKSKLNPENAGRRMLEFGYPGCDVALYGHDHQAAGSMFDRGGEQKIVVDGGTYKVSDAWGKKLGFGHVGRPGYTLMLHPTEKRMNLFRDPLMAQHYILTMIVNKEADEKPRA